jgi:hypothetical protein
VGQAAQVSVYLLGATVTGRLANRRRLTHPRQWRPRFAEVALLAAVWPVVLVAVSVWAVLAGAAWCVLAAARVWDRLEGPPPPPLPAPRVMTADLKDGLADAVLAEYAKVMDEMASRREDPEAFRAHAAQWWPDRARAIVAFDAHVAKEVARAQTHQ